VQRILRTVFLHSPDSGVIGNLVSGGLRVFGRAGGERAGKCPFEDENVLPCRDAKSKRKLKDWPRLKKNSQMRPCAGPVFVAAGFSVGVLYLFAAVLAWQLGSLPAETLAVMRVTRWALALSFAIIAVVSWKYLFILPIVFQS
jgi:hypothetical protein